MSRRPAAVVAGAVSPTDRVETAAESESRPVPVREEPDTVVLESDKGGLLVQLTNGVTRDDPTTGGKEVLKGLKLQFVQGHCVIETADVDRLHRVIGCNKDCGLHKDPFNRLCKPHPKFGIDFWNQQTRLDKEEAKKAADAEAFIAAHPEVLESFIGKNPQLVERALSNVGGKAFKLPAQAKPAADPEGLDGLEK
jgi:hypothetical protein